MSDKAVMTALAWSFLIFVGAAYICICYPLLPVGVLLGWLCHEKRETLKKWYEDLKSAFESEMK